MSATALALASNISAREMVEHKDSNIENVVADITKSIDVLGKDFKSFKDENEKELTELRKKGTSDVITKDKVEKIDKSLNDLSEAKTALEKLLADEKKEREELELKIERLGKETKAGPDLAKELKSFNVMLATHNRERGNSDFKEFTPEDYANYKSAFNKLMRKDNRLLTQDEVKVLSVGSDPDGGYLVTPDVSGQIVKFVYETSEMRQHASIQAIGTDALEGIEDLGEAGAGYAGEHAQGSDATTPQIGKWRIPVYIIDTEPKTTQQLLDDANVDVEAWLAAKVSDKFGRFENSEFVVGATKIRGFTSYPTLADSGAGVAWASFGHVVTGTNSDFGATVATQSDKLIEVAGNLKQSYLPNAKWFTRRSVITKIRKFKIGATTDSYVWSPGLGINVPETILQAPLVRMEDMPALAADSLSMAYGDMKAAYQIVDRMGIRVIRDNLTSKPYVKFYTTKRVGGGVLNFEALKFLKFGT